MRFTGQRVAPTSVGPPTGVPQPDFHLNNRINLEDGDYIISACQLVLFVPK